MSHVVAFEGALAEGVPVAWGAAALVVEGQLVNPRTGRRSSIARVDELVADGSLTQLPRSIAVPPEFADQPLIVAALNTASPNFSRLRTDTGRCPGLVGHDRQGGFQFYVFSGTPAFDRYCNAVVDGLLQVVLDSVTPGVTDVSSPEVAERFRDLLQLGMTLNVSHPQLNALRVFLANGDRFVEDLARANLRSEAAEVEFEQFLSACQMAQGEYRITLHDGVAEGGGLDVGDAARYFQNFRTIHQQAATQLKALYHFLGNAFPSPRFYSMTPASAKIAFSPSVEGRSLRERVARVYELRLIERVLRGDEPGFMSSAKVESAVRLVVQPDPRTSVRHKPLGNDSEEDLVRPFEIDQEDGRSEPFTLLGVQSGVINNAQEIEVKVSPHQWLRVSAVDNGDGEPPEGIDYLWHNRDFLFRPALFTLFRDVRRGREQFQLQRIESTSSGWTAMVTAIPSSVVGGAFLVRLALATQRPNEDSLSVDTCSMVGLSTVSHERANAWLQVYADFCRALELRAGPADSARWIRPLTVSAVPAVVRVLEVLSPVGSARVDWIVEKINQQYRAEVRANNTRREVIRHPNLLQFAPDNNQVVMVTDEGRKHFDVYRRVLRED